MSTAGDAGYVFGHSEAELDRLACQAALVEPITRQLLVDAGITGGMRVLDVGTGRGDVAFLAAELVGETGAVVGIDRAHTALAVARQRAADRRSANVSYEDADPAELAVTIPFDAVVGRYVLQFQPEPAAVLRALTRCLRPGGIVAFHEIDWTGHRSFPPVEIWDRCCRAAMRTVAARGAHTDTGTRLASIFVAAGLPAPSMRMAAIVGAGANSRDCVERLARLVRTLLPAMLQEGFVEPGELDATTIGERLTSALSEHGSFAVAASEVTAWARL
jgi:2-polyprenyl-3-methyl-5-hydroxy-6-metoxy-1,4-benzoquinol methylase